MTEDRPVGTSTRPVRRPSRRRPPGARGGWACRRGDWLIERTQSPRSPGGSPPWDCAGPREVDGADEVTPAAPFAAELTTPPINASGRLHPPLKISTAQGRFEDSVNQKFVNPFRRA